MNFFDYKAIKVWLTDTEIFAELQDGRKAPLPINKFPLLAKATKEEKEKFEIAGGYAIYWPGIGEDLSVAGFFEQTENIKQTDTSDVAVVKQ